MTATDQPTPRVGDTITTAEQLDALPVGTVVVEGDHTTPDAEGFLGITTIPGVFHRFPPPVDGWYVVAGHGARAPEEILPATVLYRPDAPHPAPVDGDAAERAARALHALIPGKRVAWENESELVRDQLLTQARAALAAAGSGEAVDREEVERLRRVERNFAMYRTIREGLPGEIEWAAFTEQYNEMKALLAARGDAAPTEAEWGRRFPDGMVVSCTEDETKPTPGAIWVPVRRTAASEWREVQG